MTALSQNDLDWFAARLSLAVYDTNREIRMGIYQLREQLKHLPGAQDLTMQNGNGGKTEIYIMGDVRVELPAGSSQSAIEAALMNPFEDVKKKLSQKPSFNQFSEATL